MLTTAAGTVTPARVFVIGAGVAGLQAIATARRLGAVVEGLRHAARREGAGRVARCEVPRDRGTAEARQGGCARELTEEEQRSSAARWRSGSRGADVVITTALVPGRPARADRRGRRERDEAGGMIVDLAGEMGGNCELTKPGGSEVTDGSCRSARRWICRAGSPRTPLGCTRATSRLARLVTGEDGELALNSSDKIVKGASSGRTGRSCRCRQEGGRWRRPRRPPPRRRPGRRKGGESQDSHRKNEA